MQQGLIGLPPGHMGQLEPVPSSLSFEQIEDEHIHVQSAHKPVNATRAILPVFFKHALLYVSSIKRLCLDILFTSSGEGE